MVEDVDASMLWQLYEAGDERCLVLCARRGKVLEGEITFGGRRIRVSGCPRLVMIRVDSRGVAGCAADGSCTIEADGMPISVEQLSVPANPPGQGEG